MVEPIIQAEKLGKSFMVGKESISALKSIDLSISPGEFIIIYGPSGCGKTTLLSLLGGLERPSRGRILVDKENINELPPNDLAQYRGQKIGMVFQQFNLIQTLNARDNVAMPLILRGVKGTAARKAAMGVLNLLEISDRAKHKPPQMSGGEQQRVAIARALASSPRILLVDEPTGNLDVPTGKEILDLLQSINTRMKRTIILVTHNPDFVKYGDRVLYMEDGQIIKEQRNSKNKISTNNESEEECEQPRGHLSIWETFRISRIHFLSKGLRTMLTTLGVALGVASIIALVSLGIGLQKITQNQLASLNMLTSIGASTNRDSANKLDDHALDKVSAIKNVVLVSPALSIGSKITVDGSTGQVSLMGIKPEALDFEGITLEAGTNYSDTSGIIISRAIAKNFDTQNPDSMVGKQTTLDLVTIPDGSVDLTKAKLVTINEKISGISNDESVSSAFISLNKIKEILASNSYSSLKVKVNDRTNVADVKTQIDNLGYTTTAVIDLIDKVDKVFLITQIALATIGSVALIVALIGIVNIMTVALLERTHEVGVLKAVGATDSNIRRIFLLEVMFYGFCGAVFGVLLAWGFGELINQTISSLMAASDIPGSIQLFVTPFYFALEMIILTVLVSLLGGWYPSKRAARLSPSEALRYE